VRGKHIEKTIIRYSSSAQSDCGSNVDHPVGTLDAALENEKSIFARRCAGHARDGRAIQSSYPISVLNKESLTFFCFSMGPA